ncbi:MAG TPA: hypothetical protein VLC91_15235 [Spongiibacteraceae bacterium]|nr:hypothetical protein [Spongiibacteraceae bacterium]
MPMVTLFFLFFMSGISGLIYQVIWVREFGLVFGSTVQSAALVTAVFMCGLGLGSYIVGRWSDRRHQNHPTLPLQAYGYSEIGIAVLGTAIALLLPQLEAFSAAFTHYEVSANGWLEITATSHALRLIAACLLLTPITFIMGGTLTLLIRHLLIANLSAVGWRVGILYGLNTAGAALGAFLTDFSLIPKLGLMGAQSIAIALNVLAGAGALLLARRPGLIAGATTTEAKASPIFDSDSRLLILGTTSALFISGFMAMGFEIVWFRYLITRLSALRAVFSLMMTVILVGIFLGAVLGGFLERRTKAPAKLYLITQTLLILFTLAPLIYIGTSTFAPISPARFLYAAGDSKFLQNLAAVGMNLQTIIIVIGIPAFLMGFTFPLANAHIQRVQSSVGRRAGTLYLANTLGNVAGALLTGFFLLPYLGQKDSVFFLAICGFAGLLPLYLTVRKQNAQNEYVPISILYGCSAVLGFLLITWNGLPPNHLLIDLHPKNGNTVLAVSEGINENLVVFDENQNGLRLLTNGHSMSTTNIFAQRYMRLFSHLPLLNIDNPQRTLVICFGVGSTLHSTSLHPSIEHLEIADLSKNVLNHGHFFKSSNRDVLKDPRLTVFINDGRQHLRMQAPDSYDLITLEPPPIAHAGVAALYSKDFYTLAKSRLKDSGYMTQWLPAYQVSPDITLAIIRSFLDVFPNAVLLSGMQNEFILMASKTGATHLDAEKMLRNIAARSAVGADLIAIGANSVTELAATFVAGPEVLARATKDIEPVTDNNPSMEYSITSAYFKTRLPESIFDASEITAWCPDCFNGNSSIEYQNELSALMRSFNTYYHSEHFLDFQKNIPANAAKTIMYQDNTCGLEIVRRNFYFKELFECKG